ncbi:DUF4255 domain-containing protein [Streptomyces sp. MZ04]|uniref:DUF4255 domain-containing protein n=1 Tax=Streptomyces sp. MZ04 TaxID=2559236 RepID=UPI00107E9918|nr:DUF4255 domain-containing protein [Streptomyces sp. MZ04]TGA83679.1 DUF4255 domain-containing protein [Streptomyces sp. MZ04]
MSDALAIAAVTETLRAVLHGDLQRTVPGAEVTVRHPEDVAAAIAEGDGTKGVLNLFLHQTGIDPAWRNADPDGSHPGECRHPALPLVLHYLFTAHVPPGENSTVPERLLGAAMAALHERPQLRADDLRAAAGFSDLHLQQEPVKVTPAMMTADEMCLLWAALGHGYRLSVAYEARVVLIDSATPGRAPLPVLRRGAAGTGPEAMPTAAARWPVLLAVVPSIAASGSDIVLSGSGFQAGTPSVRLTHPLLGGPIVLPARADEAGSLRATLGEELGAGRWSAVVVLTAPDGSERTTEPRHFHIPPRITSSLPLTAERDESGAVAMVVECAPGVHPGQRAELLVADRPVLAEPFTQETRTLRFRLAAGAPGRYPLRLRVDGVDSPLLDVEAGRFDADAAVVIT